MRKYQVELNVRGAVSVDGRISFNTDKELSYGDIFKSDIKIRKTSNGFFISTTVKTSNQDRAYKVALIFVGKMLDILSFRINSGLALTDYFEGGINLDNSVRTVIDRNEFDFCFELARDLNLNEDKLLRAMSWYRKGLYTSDPLDKFLALWNSICVVAEGYCEDTPRTRGGTINKIWNCFETLWGPVEQWPHIESDIRWINKNNDIRNKIAHGGVTVDVNYVDNVIDKLRVLELVAYQFISQWAGKIRPFILNNII